MSNTKLADAEARRRIREDFDTNLVVEAAAGTGKTTELVGRIVALLRAGRTSLDRIAAVTFTDKAAGELKLRLRGELESARVSSTGADEAKLLEDALAALETAHIGSLHSFCLDLMRERPVQARVDPAFEVFAEVDPLLEQAFDAWYQRILEDPPEGVRRVLVRRDWDDKGPRALLLKAARDLIEHRDFDARWRRDAFDRNAAIDALVTQLRQVGGLADRAAKDNDYLLRDLVPLKDLADEIATRERVRQRDYDHLEQELRQLLGREYSWDHKGRGKWFGEELLRDDVLAERDALKTALVRFADAAEADLAAVLQSELQAVVERYDDVKERAGGLDFLDMLIGVRDMLIDDPVARRELQERFTHLFVDEFQDTDPLQAEILLLLAANDPAEIRFAEAVPVAGKLFVVGDPKQAIYRFRRADVVLYQQVKEQICRHGGEVVHLTTSFRSLPAIQAAINVSFEPIMTRAPSVAAQAQYVALQPFRETWSEQPAVVALPVPAPYGAKGNITNAAIDASVPQAVAAYVEWLVRESGWKVSERQGAEEKRVPIETRHVCLLFRRLQAMYVGDVTRPYVRALEARQLPHVLAGGQAFHSREEVLALRTALTAIEWPDDELSVYATLRGPFFALSDAALFDYRSTHRRLHPLKPNDGTDASPEQAEVERALGVLAQLHRGRNRRPIAGTVQALLHETRAHAGFAIWPNGEQALANVLRVLDRARQFETTGATSFRAYVEHLEDEEARNRGREAPVVEEGTEGVRIMTVHAAKGLEFPVVILCDPTHSRISNRPQRYVEPARRLWAFALAGCVPADLRDHAQEVVEQDNAETVRVTYVAATRARDLLVVPVVGDAKRSGWVDVLHEAVHPPYAARRKAKPAPACPRFGDDSVRTRPDNIDATADDSVHPGLHPIGNSGHCVVWWDPKALNLTPAAPAGLRQMDLLLEAEDHRSSDRVQADYDTWRTRRAEVLANAGVASVVARSVTSQAAEAVAGGGADAPAVQHLSTDVEREGRPGGTRFGSLVHAILAHVPLTADEEGVKPLASALRRMLGASDAEERAAVEAVVVALRHPLIQRAANSDDCRREMPVVLVDEDGTFVEGVVDLAFREVLDGAVCWTVVDFKTDRDGPAGEQYALQVASYRRAIERATGEGTEGVLLWV